MFFDLGSRFLGCDDYKRISTGMPNKVIYRAELVYNFTKQHRRKAENIIAGNKTVDRAQLEHGHGLSNLPHCIGGRRAEEGAERETRWNRPDSPP